MDNTTAGGAKPIRFAGLTSLVAPRSVAVVGASADPGRIGGRPIAAMLSQGFEGRILPVNPNRDSVQGLQSYPTVDALPEAPDVAIVAVPPEPARAAVAELARIGAKAAIVFTSGFAEAGNAVAQEELVASARGAGMRLLGPNVLGAFNARIGYYAFFSGCFDAGFPLPGRIGIASQSGAFGSHVYAVARRRGMGTPVCITTGNEADVTLGEAIGWLAEDPDTDVIMAYAETVRDPDSFVAALACARANGKPVIMIKTGRSALGARAAQTHTAAVAGDDAVFDAVLAEHGAVRAGNTDELLDVSYAATKRIYPVGNTLGVLTLSGGAGIQISDYADACRLPMPQLGAGAQQKLKSLIPFASTINPVDCTAQIVNDVSLVGRFAEMIVGEGGYRSTLVFLTQVGGSSRMGPQIRRELKEVMGRHPDRLYAVSIVADQEVVSAFEADGFLVYEEPTRAVAALAAMGRLGQAFAGVAPAAPLDVPAVAFPASAPNEAEGKRLLASAGIATAPDRVCRTAEETVAAAEALGYPVVVKILSPDIVHKTEVGGVLLDLRDPGAVAEAFEHVVRSVRVHAPEATLDGVLVGRQLSGGVECMMGIQRDPVFGPVAVFGLGGIWVELFRDVAMRRCPFGEEEARRLILSVRGAELLRGVRGREPADVAALAAMLSKLSMVGAQAPRHVASMDLNPVLALPEGQGAFALDAAIAYGRVESGSLPDGHVRTGEAGGEGGE